MISQSRLAYACLVLAAACLLGAGDGPNDKPKNEPSDELKSVAAAVEAAIGELDPPAKVQYSNQGQTLIVSYLTQTFKIHGVSLTGEVSKDAHDEEGPSYKGFVLTAHLQPKGEVNMLVTPQTVRRPYWSTDLDVTPLGDTDKQVYWGVSYGSRTDKTRLDTVRNKLRSLKP